MEKLRPIYRDISDWAVLDEKVVYDFSEHENPIDVVEVLIGTLHYQSIGLNQSYEERRTPIIRWITRTQYENLCRDEGTVIW